MRGLVIAVILVTIVLAITGFFVFTGNDNQNIDLNVNGPGATENQTGSDDSDDSNSSGNFGTSTASPETHSIEIKGYAYTPTTLTIKAGDTVTWTNKDSVRHTVTSDSGAELASEYLSTNKNYTHTFTQPGTYKYHCKPHPNMKATIVVE